MSLEQGMVKITCKYNPPNWNEYINTERTNFYKANKIKQQEKERKMKSISFWLSVEEAPSIPPKQSQ